MGAAARGGGAATHQKLHRAENRELRKRVKALAEVNGDSEAREVRVAITNGGSNHAALRKHIEVLVEIGAYRFDVSTGTFVPFRHVDVDHIRSITEALRSGEIDDYEALDRLANLDVIDRDLNHRKGVKQLAQWIEACETFLHERRKQLFAERP